MSSHDIGELALMSEVMTVLSPSLPPKPIRAISTESWARSGAVTEPMNGLSE